jgi:hypothetical protein
MAEEKDKAPEPEAVVKAKPDALKDGVKVTEGVAVNVTVITKKRKFLLSC